jgi:hypothetical protein
LIDTATEALGDTTVGGDRLADRDPWCYQLLAGELPLTLAYLFPEIAVCQSLHSQASKTLSTGLLDLLDGEGLPHAKLFDQFRSLLACWTRCLAMARRMKQPCWTKEAQKQYRWLVGNAVTLSRRDGSKTFAVQSKESSANLPSDLSLLKKALQLGGHSKDRTLAAEWFSAKLGCCVKKGQSEKISSEALAKKKARHKPSAKAAVHSEWAATALLRSSLAPSSPKLTVLYPDAKCQVEFARGKDVFWSGDWTCDVQIGGKPALPSGEWRENCWVSDSDVDYLELELDLSEGLRLQRHFLLARKDRFLILGDAVLGTNQAALQYRGTLPLCNDIRFQRACETREVALFGKKHRALMMPLALPEWQAAESQGELNQTTDGLELRQAAEGRCLFAPLFVELDEHRMAREVTWRQLAVAESLQKQPNDVAVGYRITSGGRHWLLYRALSSVRNRSVLGHNLSTEMLIARFSKEGEVENLLEIE